VFYSTTGYEITHPGSDLCVEFRLVLVARGGVERELLVLFTRVK
jgi:hypothetical protein